MSVEGSLPHAVGGLPGLATLLGLPPPRIPKTMLGSMNFNVLDALATSRHTSCGITAQRHRRLAC
jgi:hypothetical protein